MAADFPYAGRTALSLAGDLKAGRIDAVELTEATLSAIAAYPDQALFTELLPKRAMAEANAARKRLRAGTPASPLDGVPMGWKDLFDVAGRVTTAGSVVLKSNSPATADAPLLAAASRAGLVAIGCLNMTEFAYSGIGLNPHYGTPRNPRDAKVHRSPGGSSSGSAAVVAAGLLPAAIGTDTGGSIRVPAAFNGVTGYKSSTGHYPMAGAFPLSKTLDTLGPLAHTVADCVAIDAVLRGASTIAPPAVRLADVTLIIPTNVVFDGNEPAVVANFEAAIERLQSAGVKVQRRPMPVFDAILELVARRGHLLSAEALLWHWQRVNGPDAARMDQRVVRRIRMAEGMSAVDLVDVQQNRALMIAETNEQVGEALLAFPAAPHVAMDIAPLEADQELFFRHNAKTLRNTMLGNFLDWCGVAMPNGSDAGGLPTSFLLSASHGRDAAVLAAALAIEPLMTITRS